MYYYRARYYDAELGRFVSRDPIGIADDVNLYGYVGGNPVNGADPLGLWNSEDESELYGMLQGGGASGYAMGKGLSEIKEEVGSDVKCAGKQIVEGAVKGDYVENPTGWNIVGQVGVGLTPAGVAGDIRDLNYAVNTCEGGWGCSRSVGIAMIAFAPGGDFVKAESKGDGFISNILKKFRENHHFIPWKNSEFTPEYKKITDLYGLDLKKGKWNKELLPHGGRHAREYLEWMLEQLKEVHSKADGNVDIFMKEFEKVKNAVRENPNIMYPGGWGR